jgi:protein transport protein SEC24
MLPGQQQQQYRPGGLGSSPVQNVSQMNQQPSNSFIPQQQPPSQQPQQQQQQPAMMMGQLQNTNDQLSNQMANMSVGGDNNRPPPVSTSSSRAKRVYASPSAGGPPPPQGTIQGGAAPLQQYQSQSPLQPVGSQNSASGMPSQLQQASTPPGPLPPQPGMPPGPQPPQFGMPAQPPQFGMQQQQGQPPQFGNPHFQQPQQQPGFPQPNMGLPPPSFGQPHQQGQQGLKPPSTLNPTPSRSRIDPNQIPSPLVVQEADQSTFDETQFNTFTRSVPPLASTHFRAFDDGSRFFYLFCL